MARALVGSGSLSQLAERALDEMRDALGLELVVLYLPRFAEAPTLQRYITSAGDGGEHAGARRGGVRRRGLAAWPSTSGAPLVFREEASWLVANPFVPPAGSWLVVPLVSEAGSSAS